MNCNFYLTTIIRLLLIGVVTYITQIQGFSILPNFTFIAQAQEQEPMVQISAFELSPDKTLQVCTGQKVVLVTQAIGQELTYVWAVDEGGQLEWPEGKIGEAKEASFNRYTAPEVPSQVIITVTVTDIDNQKATDQVNVQVVDCETPTQLVTSVIDCAVVAEIPQAQCEALVELYDNTDGSNRTFPLT